MRSSLAATLVLLVAGLPGAARADDPMTSGGPPISQPAGTRPARPHRTPTGGGGRRSVTPALPVAIVGNDMPEGGRAPHAEGAYGGVAPDQPHTTDTPSGRPRRIPPKGTLSWIGFEARDGGAEVFFQSAAPFSIVQSVQGGSLFVTLGLPRQVWNTRRTIDTRYFDNPLSAINAHPVGAARASKSAPAHPSGIEVRLTFKNPRDAHEAQVRTATESDGMFYTYLTFAEGADAAATTAAPDAPQGPATLANPEQ